METEIVIEYLNCIITVKLPDSEDDNTVYVEIHKKQGTFDPSLYNSYLEDFQFSGQSFDPNKWILEALDFAIAAMSVRGIRYAPLPTGIDRYKTIPNYKDLDFVLSDEEISKDETQKDDIPF